MSEPIIKVRGLGKRYRLGGARKRYKTIRESFTETLRRPFRRSAAATEDGDTTFWALKDVNFEVRPGEVVGIIGRNGAGKSTLLKVLSRITDPTEGEIEITGRLGSLLEVGTGFHPELTGRENIYLNGAILGMKRSEVSQRFDEIVAFAETEKFLDTPVKFYSSGMYTRLAFAVAAHLEPEILVVDEVLAVGDAAFQRKCLGKMKNVAGHGRTVLFVSHNMNAVGQLCKSAIVLAAGQLIAAGDAQEMVGFYSKGADGESQAEWKRGSKAFSDEFMVPERLAIVDAEGAPVATPLRNDGDYWVEIDADITHLTTDLEIGYGVSTADGMLVYWSFHTDGAEASWPKLRTGAVRLRSPWPKRLLNEGNYRVEMLAALHQKRWLLESGQNAPQIAVEVLGGLSDSPHFNHQRRGVLAPVFEWTAPERWS